MCGGVRKEFRYGLGDYILKVVLLLQAKENLHAV